MSIACFLFASSVLDQAPLRRDDRPLGSLAQRRRRHGGAERGRIADEQVQPGRQARLVIGLQVSVEEGGIGLLAEPRRRDQHQRQRLDARRLRQRRRDRAAERMADEMRARRALLDQHGARGFDQRLEARVLAQGREAVSRQIDRERGPRLRQDAKQRPPAVEVGAKAVDEHERRALAAPQPFAIDL